MCSKSDETSEVPLPSASEGRKPRQDRETAENERNEESL